MRLACLTAAAAVIFAAVGSTAQVTARLTPSRTSGVAPLAVFLDGSTSSASGINSVHELHYEWEFGDAGSGTWPHSGLSRNEDTGPWAGHVYEQPGSYTVKLTVTHPNGSQKVVTRTIQVSDPNSVYAGSKTTCFSASGNFSGCPGGAQRVTTSSFTSALEQVAPGRRLLFRRGDAFSAPTTADIAVGGPGTVGAFGTGAAPRINVSHGSSALRFSSGSPEADDWRIMDLAFVSTSSDPGSIIGGSSTTSNVLFFRLSGTGFHGNIGFSTYGPARTGTALHHDISVVECDFDEHRGGAGATGLYMAVTRMLILGNSIQNTQQIEHVTRFPYAGYAVLAHNFFARPASTKHLIKMHSLTAGKSYPFPETETHNVLISNNVFQSDLDGWAVVLGPKNHFTDERVHDIIVERNLFLAGSTSRAYVLASGRNHSIRNNIFNMTGGSSYTPVEVQRRGVEPAPRDVRIYNNTCYSRDSSSATVRCVRVGSDSRGTFTANNLLYAPNASRIDMVESAAPDTTESNNVVASSSPFVSSNPVTAPQFRPASGSNNVGANLGWASGDFTGVVRPASGGWNVGAYESANGGGGGGGASPPAAPVLLP